jgi:hypothetical protein
MPVTLSQLRESGVHFHITHGPYDPLYHHYLTQCLTEGLGRIGVAAYANRAADCFASPPEGAEQPHLRIWDVGDCSSNQAELHNSIRSCRAAEKFILCRADASAQYFTPPGIPSLITHENRFRPVKGIRLPWAHGLSDRIMAETEFAAPFDERSPTILRNFRPSRNQHVRNFLDWALVPHLEKHFSIYRAIGSDHFERLRTSIGCLAYGGTWEEDLLPHPYFANDPVYRPYRDRFEMLEPLAIIRWDSWRWFESLSAGCLTFQLDLEKHGLLMPVMPTPWRDYVPIDLADPKGTVDRLMDMRPRWQEIAANGRAWVRMHYSPDAVAARLVDYVSPAEAASPVDGELAGALGSQ